MPDVKELAEDNDKICSIHKDVTSDCGRPCFRMSMMGRTAGFIGTKIRLLSLNIYPVRNDDCGWRRQMYLSLPNGWS